ncbi:MAG: phosphoserine phosphatase SerB, partial [Cellvibrio sp.]|nr:phosphoserine phosphatase SerB [Cellvibrio sp.]
MSELLLINASGQDQPGITRAITNVLARGGARVLDIGQAVIHDTLALGILVELRIAPDVRAQLLEQIQQATQPLGIQVRFQAVTPESYENWTEQQGKPRHIVTLLARQIDAAMIAELTAVTSSHGLNIDSISRLSGRVSLADLDAGEQHQGSACVEFSVRGMPADLAALRADFMELSARLNIDVAFQRDTVYRRNRRLVCFDMDSTLI